MSVELLQLEGHTIYAGTTGYGKTTLAKAMCKVEKEKGLYTFVLDPVLQPDWGSHYLTDDPETFVNAVWEYAEQGELKQRFLDTREVIFSLYFDECGDYTPKQWFELRKFQKKGRNYGMKVSAIGQRVFDMNKGARTQCESFIISGQSEEDIPVLRNITKSRKFEETADEFFPKMHYLIKEGSGKPVKAAKWSFDARTLHGGRLEFIDSIPLPVNPLEQDS